MSNWVYNRVYCNEKAKEKIINYDDEKEKMVHFHPYGLETSKNGNGKFLLEFETHGSDYREDFIKFILNEYKDTVWQCIEENLVEEAKFYVKHDEIKVDTHELIFNYSDSIFDYLLEYEGFYIPWPHLTISLIQSNKKLLMHDLDNFKFYEYTLEENDYNELIYLLEEYKKILSEYISFYTNEKNYHTFYYLDNCIEDTNDLNDTRNEGEREKVNEFMNCLNKIIVKYNSKFNIYAKY